MTPRRLAAVVAAVLLCASAALAQEKLPPLRTGVDGTFAPHAMPKLGGGVEGFQIDLFTEVARRMKRAALMLYVCLIPLTFPFLGVEGIKVTLRMAWKALRGARPPRALPRPAAAKAA